MPVSEERFRLLFQNSPDAMVLADDGGRYMDVNDAACDLFGYSREQLLDMKVGDLTVGDGPTAEAQFQDYLQTGRRSGEFTFMRADGQTRVASYSACRVAPGEHLSILRDITDQKHALLHQEFKSGLADRVRLLSDPEDILWTVAQAVGRHLNVSRAHFNEVDVEADRITVHRNYTENTFSSEGTYALSSFGSTDFLAALHGGQVLVVSDAALDSRTADAYEMAYRPLNVRAFVIVPCMRGGNWVGAFILDSSALRIWTPAEISLAESVSQRAWLAVDAVRQAQMAQKEETQKQEALRALRESEQQAKQIIEAAPIGVMVADTSGKIRQVNDAFVAMLGYTREEALSGAVNWRELTPPEWRHLDLSAIEEIQRTGRHAPFEKEYFRKDGTRLPVLVTTAFLGGPEEIGVGFIVDLEERKRTEASLRDSAAWYRRLADAMPQIVWTARPDGYIDYYNERWYAFTGFPRGEGGDTSWKPILHPDDLEHCYTTWYNSVRTGDSYQIEYRFKDHKNGGYRWFLGRAVPVYDEDGKILKWFGTCTDITEHKEDEEILHRHQSEVEDLNIRLRRAIQETHHRVKNNLQVISALVDLQVEEAQDLIPVSAMTRIGRHARSLAEIHDLLTQETKAGAYANTISTRAAMNKLVPLLQSTTGGRNIRFQVEDVRLPMREGASLALLVSELVSNAVKHGRGEITLTLAMQKDFVALEVSDEGPGFPPGFDWNKAANTGFGLIDSTGRYDLRGTIAFENRYHGGACVRITFPVPAPVSE